MDAPVVLRREEGGAEAAAAARAMRAATRALEWPRAKGLRGDFSVRESRGNADDDDDDDATIVEGGEDEDVVSVLAPSGSRPSRFSTFSATVTR